jgi:hypothetical protein
MGTSVWVDSSVWGWELEVEVEVDEKRGLERGLMGRAVWRDIRGVRGEYREVSGEWESREMVRRARKGEIFDAMMESGVYLQHGRLLESCGCARRRNGEIIPLG